ncbi:hypothetical protein NK718_07075 [Alsobacter sp. SYSU M60028]|uniref:MerR family transcriptional regulator n=1 Tax=Alsobacter ponti TaxID=2962936 RepID=A0ABT1LBE9_9HYPH|nr:hypothetical protein [Alsobacter ponti]MCP8938273.1 hypothetical protein [Alsobacter ponti]
MPIEIVPGELLEDRDVVALVALAAGGVTPQDARTLRVYEGLRALGLAQRRDAANDDWSLPSFGLTEDGETALRFHWTEIAGILERLGRDAREK